jgi:hypothetical protein
MNTLESYQQTYIYDTGNNLTNLSHQARSNTWQQTIAISIFYYVLSLSCNIITNVIIR